MANGSHPKNKSGNYYVPERLPSGVLEEEWKNREYKPIAGHKEMRERAERIEANQKTKKDVDWMPVQGSFPRLVFETKTKWTTLQLRICYMGMNPDRPLNLMDSGSPLKTR